MVKVDRITAECVGLEIYPECNASAPRSTCTCCGVEVMPFAPATVQAEAAAVVIMNNSSVECIWHAISCPSLSLLLINALSVRLPASSRMYSKNDHRPTAPNAHNVINWLHNSSWDARWLNVHYDAASSAFPPLRGRHRLPVFHHADGRAGTDRLGTTENKRGGKKHRAIETAPDSIELAEWLPTERDSPAQQTVALFFIFEGIF